MWILQRWATIRNIPPETENHGVPGSRSGSRNFIFFREACNKVLYADHVNFETPAEPPPVPSDTPEPLTGHLTLYGRLHGKE